MQEQNIQKKTWSNTIDSYIAKYGPIDGPVRYAAYRAKTDPSLKGYIARYGEQIGTIKYNERHAKNKKPLYERLACKYGEHIAKQKYAEYLSRVNGCHTLEHYIKKYGEVTGREKYEKSCQRKTKEHQIAKLTKEHGMHGSQVYIDKKAQQTKKCITTKSNMHIPYGKKGFIERYGEERGMDKYNEWISRIGPSLEKLCNKYGQEEGAIRYQKFLKKLASRNALYQSKVATDMFAEIAAAFPDYKCMYGSNEFCTNTQNGVFFVDFYCCDTKKIIEFYGDYWHCNPEKYPKDYFHTSLQKTAEQRWQDDEHRIQYIKEATGCDVLVVWETEFIQQRTQTIEKCKTFIKQKML